MISSLTVGKRITVIQELNNSELLFWEFRDECAYLGTPLMPGTQLKVVEVNRERDNMWIKAELPCSYPHKYLKISDEEFETNFKLI